MPGRFQIHRDKVIGITLLLVAMLAVFFLRVPCNLLAGSGPSAAFRTHRSHALPSCAILSDVFCAVLLVALPFSLAAMTIGTFVPAAFSTDHFPIITTLRC